MTGISEEEQALLTIMDTLASMRQQAHLEGRQKDWENYANADIELQDILQRRGYTVSFDLDRHHSLQKQEGNSHE